MTKDQIPGAGDGGPDLARQWPSGSGNEKAFRVASRFGLGVFVGLLVFVKKLWAYSISECRLSVLGMCFNESWLVYK